MSEVGTVSLWPLVAYSIATALLVTSILFIAHFTGERRRERVDYPYESGMNPTGSTHLPMGVTYYLIAMFFLIFDLAATFSFAWAVSVRETGWSGYMVMLVFIGVLTAGFLYLWREGVLEAGKQQSNRATEQQS